MNSYSRSTLTVLGAFALTSAAYAGNPNEVLVASDITGNEVWTTDKTYNLQGQIYVNPGATLTIQKGVVVASDPGGSLAVAATGQIFVQGTASEPVIMTSKADLETWSDDPSHPTMKDPATGSWRQAATEWGNLTIMGRGYISEDATAGNVAFPDAGNVADMEGLFAEPDNKNQYGGGMDDDDSGTISYLNLRYGGRVIGFANELNGLSLGGVGSGTDISFVEIMNNVDDGIEIWGGCVGIKNFSVWNIGDDSLDFDQGWRGKAQFGLIVQGYSLNAEQGSGVGDNAIEMDGAEDCNWQPVSTVALYNMTVIGEPNDGDAGTAWRDNARVQVRNSVFVDLGDKLVKNDGDDGDGACGYGGGAAGMQASTFAEVWADDFDDYFMVNPPVGPLTLAELYKSQVDGKQAEIRDSVFFNLQSGLGDAPVDLSATLDNVVATASPIKCLVREDVVTLLPGSPDEKDMARVIALDPRAANDAVASVGSGAPFASDSFYSQAAYRGAFDANTNWLDGWATSDAFRFLADAVPASESTFNSAIAANPNAFLTSQTQPPVIDAIWDPAIDHSIMGSAAPAASFLYVGTSQSDLPTGTSLGTVLCGVNSLIEVVDTFVTGPIDTILVPIPAQAALIGNALCAQGGVVDLGSGLPEFKLANGINFTIGCE
ncbi:MAG: hypothetical protein AAF682_27010 [Planctomycetota bacterium]